MHFASRTNPYEIFTHTDEIEKDVIHQRELTQRTAVVTVSTLTPLLLFTLIALIVYALCKRKENNKDDRKKDNDNEKKGHSTNDNKVPEQMIEIRERESV